MLLRIVKMTFRPEAVATFRANFDQNKAQIRAFPGCAHLELWQDRQQPALFFTYSWWQAEADLENYRQSALFRQVWAQTKALFAAPAEAWSLQGLENVNP
jgi:hypothetical protein